MKSLDEIFGKKKSLDEIFSSVPEVTPEIRAQIEANNQAYAMRQEENRPWVDKNSASRIGVAAVQGIANSSLNPFGYIGRAAGIDTKPFEPQNMAERGTELAGEYGFDAAALGGIGKIAQGAGYLGKGQSALSKVAQEVLAPESGAALLSRFVAPATAGAMVEGATNPTNQFERTLANIAGAGIVGGVEGALRKTTTPTRGGLKNVLPNDKANAAISKGIRADKEVARQVRRDAPAAYNELNKDMAEALDKATGRKLDIEGALDSQQQRYNDFIYQNADKQVFSDGEMTSRIPTREQIKSISPQSKYNPNKKLTKEEADALLRDRAALQKLGIYNDELSYLPNAVDDRLGIQHLLGESRNPYIRTLNNTLDKPDISFSSGGRDFNAKMYKNGNTGKNFMDWIITEDGKIVSKYPTTPNHVSNQIQNSAQNMSLSARVPTGYDGATYTQLPAGTEYNIPQSVSNVNSNAQKLSQFIQDLTGYQKEALGQALNKGASMSTQPKGTLGATHRAQEVLNDMIDASYDTSIIGQKRPTTETRQLMGVKDVLNKILEPSGVKPYDAGISKAKALRAAFEKGYNFKPSEVKYENLGIDTRREQKAFLQGHLSKLKDNILSDGGTNLATAVKKSENVFRKVMPKDKFDSLMNKANDIEESFKRLKSLEGQADKELIKETERGVSPWRENVESRGSLIGRGLDVLSGVFNRGARRRLANAYLNPQTNQIVERGGMLGALKGMSAADSRQLLIDLLNRE